VSQRRSCSKAAGPTLYLSFFSRMTHELQRISPSAHRGWDPRRGATPRGCRTDRTEKRLAREAGLLRHVLLDSGSQIYQERETALRVLQTTRGRRASSTTLRVLVLLVFSSSKIKVPARVQNGSGIAMDARKEIGNSLFSAKEIPS